jgi:hypothetical protein
MFNRDGAPKWQVRPLGAYPSLPSLVQFRPGGEERPEWGRLLDCNALPLWRYLAFHPDFVRLVVARRTVSRRPASPNFGRVGPGRKNANLAGFDSRDLLDWSPVGSMIAGSDCGATREIPLLFGSSRA